MGSRPVAVGVDNFAKSSFEAIVDRKIDQVEAWARAVTGTSVAADSSVAIACYFAVHTDSAADTDCCTCCPDNRVVAGSLGCSCFGTTTAAVVEASFEAVCFAVAQTQFEQTVMVAALKA